MIKVILLAFFVGCAGTPKLAQKELISLTKEHDISTKSFINVFPVNSQMIQLVKYTREGQTKTTQVILKRKKKN